VAEAVIERLGIAINLSNMPKANYLSFVLEGRMLYLSGQAGRGRTGKCSLGKVWREVTEQAYLDARQVGINLVSIARLALGSIDRVERVISITCFVSAAPDFTGHAKVVDGCSDLLVDVFGEAGRHTPSAVGAGSLPNNITLEADAVFLVRAP
jgi:enamine deaminase RidA (YjgF/YER057c/UK114 family)